MNAGYFVGRVGGLAVALGVGAAVSFGCSTAWAADGTTDTGSVSSDSGAGSNIAAGGSSAADSPQDPGGSSADPGAGDTGDSTAPADADEADPASDADPEPSAQDPDPQPSTDVDSGTDEENADVADDFSDDAPTPVTHNKNRVPDEVPADDPAPEPDPAPVTRKVSAPDTEIDAIPAADGQSDPAPAVEPRSIVVNTIVTTPTTTPIAGGTDPVVAQPDPQADPAATTTELATAVAASLLGSNAPGDIPVNTPAEWIMLAAARRELADPDEQPTTGTLGIQSLATPLAITPDAPTAAPDPIGDILTGAFQTITGILSTAASIARGTVTGALDLIGGIIDLAATATTVVLNTAINVVNWGISTTANLITGALATAVNALADAFDSSPTPLGDAIAGTLTFLNNVVSTTVNVLSQAATDVLSFTADGLSTAVTLLSDTVVGTLNLATQAVDIALQTINQFLNPNSAPLAADDLANATEDTVALILAADLLANDTDPEADTLSISALTQAAHGTTSKAANGDITYTPNTNFNGTDTFTYTITDGAKTSTATVTVTVTPVNDAPVGVNDNVTTTEDTPKTITADSLLANDSDPEDDPFSITAVGQGTRGTTGRSANGDIIYTPGLNVSGTDTFTYTISDGDKSSTATVTVTITPTNDAPIAGSDTSTTAEDTPKTIAASTLLGNDSDPDHDALSITAAGQGVHGATTRAANGDITYAPNANFNGTDTFTYTITDGTKTSTATVTVTVTPVNDAPAAVNDTASTTQGVAVTFAANTLLANDSDVDTAHNALSITATTQGAHGTTSRATNGDVVYTPDATFAGTDSFTYTVSDGALSSTATIIVTVTGTTPIEHSPVANNDNATTDEDTPKTITANTLLANDSDADNDTLTITATTQGSHGTTSKAANGDITYTPNANYNGTDTFTYTITDGTTTSTATVTVTITPVNDVPAGVNDIASTTQGLAITLTANTLLANDTDVDTAHSALSITAATQGAHGTTSKATNGDITYIPDATFAGTDTFTYTVSDGALSSTAQVAVTVIPAHVAGDHIATTAEDAPLTLAPNTLLGNGSDTVSDVGAASHGITSRADDGTITYTPALNFNGTDFFTYTASDGYLTGVGTVTVTVTPVNDAPTNGSSSSGAPNAITGVVIGSVSADDPDDDTLTYSAPATTAKGSLTLVGNTFTYTPTAAARAAAEAADASVADKFDVFTVTASDGHGQPLAIPVTVIVAPPTSANISTGSLAVHRVIAMSGTQFGIIAVNGDGSRAIVEAVTAGNSDSGQIALINTITGSVIKTFTLDGAPSTTDRAYFTNDSDYVVVAGSKHTLILNAAGEQVGDALPGTTTADVDLNKATGQLVITNGAWVTLINDLATGDPVVVSDPDSPYVDDDVVELDIVAKHVELAAKDYPEWYSYYAYDAPVAQLSDDGSHLVIMVSGGTYFAPDQVRTALIDAHTGELISGTLHTIRTSAQEGAIVVDPRPAIAGATIATDEDGNPVINNDGSRLLIERLNRSSDLLSGYAVLSTDLMVVDTTTGQQVGSTITVDGRPIGDAFAAGYYTATLAANGTEAIVTITTDDYIAGSTGSGETSVIVIDMEDGGVLGTITEHFTLPMGSKPPVVRFSTDGGKAVVLETNGDAVIIDHGGSQVGSTISLPGAFANFSADISADGSLAVVSGSLIHSAGGDKTYVQVINAATGAAVGETFVANGSGTATLNAAHTRVIVSTDQGVSILNTATGAQVGTTIAGTSLGTNADGSHALVATVAGSEQSGYTSTLRVVNTLTGAIIGAPVVVPGTVKVWTGFDYSTSASFNSSGTRAIVTTSDGSGSNIKLAAIDLDAGALAGGITSVNGNVRQAATFATDSNGFLLTSSTAGSTSTSTSGSTALVTGFTVT